MDQIPRSSKIFGIFESQVEFPNSNSLFYPYLWYQTYQIKKYSVSIKSWKFKKWLPLRLPKCQIYKALQTFKIRVPFPFNPLLPGHFQTNYLSSSEVECFTENNDEGIARRTCFSVDQRHMAVVKNYLKPGPF